MWKALTDSQCAEGQKALQSFKDAKQEATDQFKPKEEPVVEATDDDKKRKVTMHVQCACSCCCSIAVALRNSIVCNLDGAKTGSTPSKPSTIGKSTFTVRKLRVDDLKFMRGF